MRYSEEIKRRGRFFIPARVFYEKPSVILQFFNDHKIVVTRCEHRFAINALEYEGFSVYFKPIEEGDESPLYHLSHISRVYLTPTSRVVFEAIRLEPLGTTGQFLTVKESERYKNVNLQVESE